MIKLLFQNYLCAFLANNSLKLKKNKLKKPKIKIVIV